MPTAARTRYNAAGWLLDRHVAAGDGDRLAVICGDDHLTYADVQRQVWRAQHALRALDVRAGERVAMVVNDEPAFMAWFLGGLRSGVVPVPLSTMLTADDLAAIVEDAGAGRRRRLGRLRRPPADHRQVRAGAADRGRARRSGLRRRRRPAGPRLERVRRPRRGAGRRHRRGLPRLLALQLGHDRPAQGRHAPPRQPPGHGRDLRRVRARGSGPTTGPCRWPSCSSRTGWATR